MNFDDLFTLASAGAGRWRAPGAPETDEPRLFGGLLVGQAIAAACVQTRRLHALHALFIGAGYEDVAFELAVERTRDGRSFATRRIEIRQRERLLLAAYSSHHDGDDGPEHQIAMPDVPPPENFEDQRDARAKRAAERGKAARRYLFEDMLDVRPFDLPALRSSGDGETRAIWFRARTPLHGGRALHQAAIGFASDVGLVHAGLQQHRAVGDDKLQAASLDHSIWFHRDAAADEWMLHVQRAPVVANGRGLSHGAMFARDGRLVASVAQEFIARRHRDR